eukprot:77891_1
MTAFIVIYTNTCFLLKTQAAMSFDYFDDEDYEMRKIEFMLYGNVPYKLWYYRPSEFLSEQQLKDTFLECKLLKHSPNKIVNLLVECTFHFSCDHLFRMYPKLTTNFEENRRTKIEEMCLGWFKPTNCMFKSIKENILTKYDNITIFIPKLTWTPEQKPQLIVYFKASCQHEDFGCAKCYDICRKVENICDEKYTKAKELCLITCQKCGYEQNEKNNMKVSTYELDDNHFQVFCEDCFDIFNG